MVDGGSTGDMIGGLVGLNYTLSTTLPSIRNCYSTGAVTGKSGTGGLVGSARPVNGSIVSNSFWNLQTSGQSGSAKGTALTTPQMQTQSSFTGFDFTNTWSMVNGQTYPLLSFQRSNIIYNVTQLQRMQENPGGQYFLGADIDAAATRSDIATWGNDGFEPVGTQNAPFTGSLDGNGHTISHLTINKPSTDNVGLFGYTSATARISNVGMKDTEVTGQNNVGALVGYNNAAIDNSFSEQVNGTALGSNSSGSGGLAGFNTGIIISSHSSGNLTGIDDVGGLVGVNKGQITNSHSWTKVSNATGQAGGLVGTNQQGGSISASYASGLVGDVGTTGIMGGLVGINNGSISFSNAVGRVDCGINSTCGGLVAKNGSSGISASISNSYATGGVDGTGNDIGGLVGNNAKDSTISTSYATGKIKGSGNVGGLIGNNEGSIASGYWNVSLSKDGVGKGSANGATGLTAAGMLVSSSFANFALTTTPGANGWLVINTDGSLQSAASAAAAATSPMLATEYSTRISNPHQLQLMLLGLTANYSISAEIDALTTGNGNDVWGPLGFVPVGNATHPFSGSLNGEKNRIKHLRINRTDNNVGIFGYTNNATISNVKILDATVVGANTVGALAGSFNGGSVSNIFSNGFVSGAFTFQSAKGDNIGGLIGQNSGLISYSSSSGGVYGGRYVGGLVGNNLGAISRSASTANVNARTNFSGGLAGRNAGNISNTYAAGDLISKNGFGGLVGINSVTCTSGWPFWECNESVISNSYARSRLLKSTNNQNVGGLLGLNAPTCSQSWWFTDCKTGAINSSYWDTSPPGMATSAAGTGLPDAQMRQQSSFSGWDFTNTWAMDTYPVLLNMPTP